MRARARDLAARQGLGIDSERCGKTEEGLDKGRASFTFSEEPRAPGGGARRHPDGGGNGGKGWSSIRVGGGDHHIWGEQSGVLGMREKAEVTPSQSRVRSEVY